MTVNRRWTLARRPMGRVATEDFALIEEPFDAPTLRNGELLVRNRVFAIAPTIRNWLNPPGRSDRGSIPIGEAIAGMAGCEVVASRHPDWRAGDRLIAMARWEEWSVIAPGTAAVPPFRLPAEMDFTQALGPLSLNSLTAYFGMTEIGRVAAGDVVLVSGAAGSVGSVACQIARILGARVIAIAGGPDKCAWLRDACGVDATIDYRREDVAARLAETCPDGIGLFFDNVGGAILDAAVDRMALRGRIVLCGQIAAYDGDAPAQGPSDMMKLVYRRIRMEGFVVGDFVDRADEARAALGSWIDDGMLAVRVDRRQGFEAIPAAFVDLFSGRNVGTLIVAAD
ncbi:NADP-dependent oxidoreductase [Sphingomonas sp. MMSM20]|uniref:NADP-dependent oxidoreductase n=1 Tax=Sphingomonas lycopersici TaxID=2951807 RepID=UPI00223866BF|nr:NADP-dependent oxidoreductase [Sphingomonas lycopersici]MCW6532745.1 NADP-dependent oxidoreductase [Sphingomonas lycopersici]